MANAKPPIENTLSEAARDFTQTWNQINDEALSAVRRVGQEASQAAEDVLDEIETRMEKIVSKIDQHRLLTWGAVFASGCILGAILRTEIGFARSRANSNKKRTA